MVCVAGVLMSVLTECKVACFREVVFFFFKVRISHVLTGLLKASQSTFVWELSTTSNTAGRHSNNEGGGSGSRTQAEIAIWPARQMETCILMECFTKKEKIVP